jgi:hypothetical protein
MTSPMSSQAQILRCGPLGFHLAIVRDGEPEVVAE